MMIPGNINPLLLGSVSPILPFDTFEGVNGSALNGRTTTPVANHTWSGYGTYGGTLTISNNAVFIPQMRQCGLINNTGLLDNFEVSFTVKYPINTIAIGICVRAEFIGTPNLTMIPTNCIYYYFSNNYCYGTTRISDTTMPSQLNLSSYIGTFGVNTDPPDKMAVRIVNNIATLWKNNNKITNSDINLAAYYGGITSSGIGFVSLQNNTSQPILDNLIVTLL